jgi:hypothetical protein
MTLIDEELRYSERAVSWRPLWVVAGLIVVGFCVDVALPGGNHLLAWTLAFVGIVGVMGIGMYARTQYGSLSVSALQLKVGRESVPLSTVDIAYLRDSEAGGPPVGARVLGGGSSVPKGREALPVRLTDGAVVLVPCRDPGAVRTALLGWDQSAL